MRQHNTLLCQMETKGKNRVPSGAGIFFLDLSIWCKTYHVRVLLQKTHLSTWTKMVIPEFNIHVPEFFMTVSVYYKQLPECFTTLFSCDIVSLFKIQQNYYMWFGKGNGHEWHSVLQLYSKMILSCKSRLLHRAWATGYKIHWEENVIFL